MCGVFYFYKNVKWVQVSNLKKYYTNISWQLIVYACTLSKVCFDNTDMANIVVNI